MMKNFKLELDCLLNVLKIQNEEGDTDGQHVVNYLEAYEVKGKLAKFIGRKIDK